MHKRSNWPNEDYDADYKHLVDSMSENISPHNFSNDSGIFVVWFSLKDVILRWFGSKGESSKGVHDQVDRPRASERQSKESPSR